MTCVTFFVALLAGLILMVAVMNACRGDDRFDVFEDDED